VLNGEAEKSANIDIPDYRGLTQKQLDFLKENNEDLYNKIYDSDKNEFKQTLFGGQVTLTDDEKRQIEHAANNRDIGQIIAENWEGKSQAIKEKLEDLGANWKNYDDDELNNILNELDKDTQKLIRK
jgi:hypothetical protein